MKYFSNLCNISAKFSFVLSYYIVIKEPWNFRRTHIAKTSIHAVNLHYSFIAIKMLKHMWTTRTTTKKYICTWENLLEAYIHRHCSRSSVCMQQITYICAPCCIELMHQLVVPKFWTDEKRPNVGSMKGRNYILVNTTPQPSDLTLSVKDADCGGWGRSPHGEEAVGTVVKQGS
jgi:hypothetical protein